LLERRLQTRQFRDDDPAQMISARQAAEALFRPQPAVNEQSAVDPAQSAKPRKPRVLPALSPATLRPEKVNAPAVEEQPTDPEVTMGKWRAFVRW